MLSALATKMQLHRIHQKKKYDKYALRIHSVKNDAEYIFLLTKSTPRLVLFMSVLKTTGLNLPHVCAYTKPEPGFPTSYQCSVCSI
jgi:hypothetical protein